MVLGQICKLRGGGGIITLLPAWSSAPLTFQCWLWTKLSCFMPGDNFVINHIAAFSISTQKTACIPDYWKSLQSASRGLVFVCSCPDSITRNNPYLSAVGEDFQGGGNTRLCCKAVSWGLKSSVASVELLISAIKASPGTPVAVDTLDPSIAHKPRPETPIQFPTGSMRAVKYLRVSCGSQFCYSGLRRVSYCE